MKISYVFFLSRVIGFLFFSRIPTMGSSAKKRSASMNPAFQYARTGRHPTLTKSPSWSFTVRSHHEIDRLASCTPFYAAFGTHRAQFGETLLTDLRCRNDRTQNILQRQGRHWKATPGPGRYREKLIVGVDRTNAPAWPFAKCDRGDWHPITKTPGPGTYTNYVEIHYDKRPSK